MGLESFKGKQVGGGEVVYVNVVANAGSIFGGIVSTEDGDELALPKRHLQHERNEMALTAMRFAAVGSGSRGVEVTQAGIAKSVGALEPGEHLFNEELGFAVGIGGGKLVVFGNRNGLRLSVNGGSGGENEAQNVVAEHHAQKREGTRGVVVEV